MIEVAKALSYNQTIMRGLSPLAPVLYTYIKIMILLNTFSSQISWPISTKFHVDPTAETGLRVCSNGHTPLTVMHIYSKIMITKNTHILLHNQELSNGDPFISCNDRIGKLLHNICISAVAVSLS